MADDPKKTTALPDDGEPDPEVPSLTRGQVRKARARAQAAVEKARIEAAMERVEAAEKARLEREEGSSITGEPVIEVVLNLCPTMKHIALDGKLYMHRGKYPVRESVARELLFTMYKGWEQEAARQGQDKLAFYMSRANAATPAFTINGRTGAVSGTVPQGTH